MLSRNGCYVKAPDVVLRPFEEWGHVYAFVPDAHDIVDLNSTAYFIVELCTDRPYEQIRRDFIETVGDKIGSAIAGDQFDQGFAQLLERNIISASDE